MNEKDFNLAILNKLYEIAHKVFAEGVKIADGSYYATDLAKKGSEIFKDGYLKTEYKQTLEYDPNKYDKKQKIEKDCFVAPMATVSVLSFVCSFCVVKIFDLVARFEKLAGIPTKDRQIFVAASNIGNVLCTFEVEINKDLGTLSKFVDMKDDIRPLMENVCLDIRNHRAVASNGHVLQIRQFAVCAGSAWDDALGCYYPLINADVWKKMCSLAGKGAKVTCKLVGEDINSATGNHWICECKGITSKVDARRYVNYESVISDVDSSKVAQLDKKTWNAAKKWIKSSSVTNDILIIKHEEGSAKLTFKMRDLDFDIENVSEFNCVGVPYERFSLCVKASTLVKVVDEFNLFVPQSANRAIYFISDKDIKLVMPLILPNEESNYNLDMTDKKNAFYVANFPTKEQIKLLNSANERTQDIESAKVVSSATEQKEERTEQKNESAKVVDVPTKEQTKVASKVTLDADMKKFTFDKVGVKAGDVLTFVDGTEVIAAEDNKVSFCGELFTLSGFCKEFMPSDKRTKSNAYRGCDYFYKDGVKLGKLLKEYQKKAMATLESKTKEVASVPAETLEHETEQTDNLPRWERKFNERWANESESVRTVVKGSIKYYLNNSIYAKDDDGAIYHLQVSYYNAKDDSFIIKDANDLETILWVGADRQRFNAWYHSHSITKERYYSIKYNDPILKELCKEEYKEPLDDAPSEQEQTEETTAKVINVSVEPLERTERTITPSAKDIAAERKELANNANNMVCDVGILAKVVTISLGVPPEYGVAASGALPIIEPPNEGVRLVDVGCERFTSDVGSCLGVAGKVVHTLPLPPPQGKRNIKSLSFICYVRRNSKQSKEGSLRVHRETKEMYWRFGGMQPP